MTHRLPSVVVRDVGVDVHRDGDLRVAQDLHHDARRHTGGTGARRTRAEHRADEYGAAQHLQ